MTNLKQALPPDHQAYGNIQYLAGQLAHIVDELTFEPLYGKHTKVLSICSVIPQVQGRDLWLTAWHGFRDGRGKDGSAVGFWVRADEGSPGRDEGEIVPLDPEQPGAGLTYSPEDADRVRQAVATIYKLLIIAEETHRGLVGLARLRSFIQLSEAASEGITGWYSGEEDIDEAEEEDDTGPVDLLQLLCEESDFDAIEFGPRGPAPEQFASTGTLVIDGDAVQMTVWAGLDDGRVWLELAGRIQALPRERTDDPEVQWPDEDDETNEWLAEACEELVEIHNVAAGIFNDITTGDPGNAYSLLSAVAEAAAADYEDVLGPGFLSALQEVPVPHDDDAQDVHVHDEGHDNPHHKEWHHAVDEFTRQCRYGFLYRISVQESPYGAADVSAEIRPPGMEEKVPVKVFMHQGELETVPGHWFAAGEMMCPAHGKDVDIVGLVSGFPAASQAFIAHSLEHLHTTSHVIVDILQGRLSEIMEVLEPIVETTEEMEDMVKVLYAAELADTLAGLNGIARLHTGNAGHDGV